MSDLSLYVGIALVTRAADSGGSESRAAAWVIAAASEDEALGRVVRAADEMYPEAEGWRKAESGVTRVAEDVIDEVRGGGRRGR